jgi:hypothetical protein
MSDNKNEGEKKIIVDEDWKSQVEAEKEAASQNKQQGQAEQPSGAEEALPAPTLTFLASTIFMQGAIAMGLLPNPITDKSVVQIDQARHAIDLLTMLQQKTEGNRTPEETEDFESMLHQLRMAFIAVTQNKKV